MMKFKEGGYIRISRREARSRYNAGEVVRFCPVKCSPVNVWGMFADCSRESFPVIGGDGFNTVVPRGRDFETVINAFAYYNCNGETGRYPAFYITETQTGSRYKRGKEAARTAAQEWQAHFGNRSMTWGELAEWQDHFTRLGRKYGLLREFAENGII